MLAELGELAPELSERVVTLKGRRAHRTKRLLTVGLLRDLSRLNFARIAETTESSDTTAKRRYRFHASALDEDPAYAELACQLVARCVAPLEA